MQNTLDTYGLELLNGLERGTIIYGVTRSVSASGLSRNISLKVIKDNQLINLTYYAGEILGKKVKSIDGFNALNTYSLDELVNGLSFALHGESGYFRAEQA
jgi:hypothetical protein